MSGELIRAVLLACLAALIALPVGHFAAPWMGWTLFCVSLGLQLAFHFRNFARLDRWSRAPVVDASLEGAGAWDGVFGRLYRHEKDLRAQIDQRDREIAMLIAGGSEILVLDEPLAGMGPEDTARVVALLRALRENHTIILIEHDMDAVFAVADTLTVLVGGLAVDG